jgi:Skp family chaperone for outer membrane proteins
MKALFSAVILIIAFIAFSAPAAPAACSQDEMTRKAIKVAERLEELKNRDETEYQRILLRFNNIARQLDQNDRDAWCALYDQLLLEI